MKVNEITLKLKVNESSIHSTTFRNTVLKHIVTVTKTDKKNSNSKIPRDLTYSHAFYKLHMPYIEGLGLERFCRSC